MKKLILLVILLLGISFTTLCESPISQPQSSPQTHEVGHENNSGAPIDGGVCILLMCGAVYGAYKLYKIKKKIL